MPHNPTHALSYGSGNGQHRHLLVFSLAELTATYYEKRKKGYTHFLIVPLGSEGYEESLKRKLKTKKTL